MSGKRSLDIEAAARFDSIIHDIVMAGNALVLALARRDPEDPALRAWHDRVETAFEQAKSLPYPEPASDEEEPAKTGYPCDGMDIDGGGGCEGCVYECPVARRQAARRRFAASFDDLLEALAEDGSDAVQKVEVPK